MQRVLFFLLSFYSASYNTYAQPVAEWYRYIGTPENNLRASSGFTQIRSHNWYSKTGIILLADSVAGHWYITDVFLVTAELSGSRKYRFDYMQADYLYTGALPGNVQAGMSYKTVVKSVKNDSNSTLYYANKKYCDLAFQTQEFKNPFGAIESGVPYKGIYIEMFCNTEGEKKLELVHIEGRKNSIQMIK